MAFQYGRYEPALGVPLLPSSLTPSLPQRMASSFEAKAREAIERVYRRLEHLDRGWELAVEQVFRCLAPHAQGRTRNDWIEGIRVEILRIQAERGVSRRAAITMLESRLECLPYEQRKEKARNFTTAAETKLNKKMKMSSRKRSKSETC